MKNPSLHSEWPFVTLYAVGEHEKLRDDFFTLTALFKISSSAPFYTIIIDSLYPPTHLEYAFSSGLMGGSVNDKEDLDKHSGIR